MAPGPARGRARGSESRCKGGKRHQSEAWLQASNPAPAGGAWLGAQRGKPHWGVAYPFLAKEAAFIQKSMGCLGRSPNPSEPRARASRFLPGAATPQAKGRPDRTALINAGASWAQPGTERTGLGSSIGAGLGVGHLAGTGQGHTVPRGLGRSWRSPGTPLGMGVHQGRPPRSIRSAGPKAFRQPLQISPSPFNDGNEEEQSP